MPSDQVTQIPKAELDKAHRRLCREVAASLLSAMAEADVGFYEMAVALEIDERSLRRYFYRLMDGRTRALREISDLATAMGRRVLVGMEPVRHAG